MFNTAMFYLNVIHLSFIPQFARFALAHVLPTREHQYGANDSVGYAGWVSAPLVGVVAFRTNDGALQYKW